MRVFLLVIKFLISISMGLAITACGGDDDSVDHAAADASVDAATDDLSGHMSAEALQELVDVGLDAFLGAAVVAGEKTEGNVTSYTFDPASGPVCLRGTDFIAHVRDTGSDSLLFYLDGMGACWTGYCLAKETADLTLPVYGLLDPYNEENVARDWNVVFLPFCDGSLFLGNNEVQEPDGSTRYHHGRQNLSAGVDLALKHFPDVRRIIIAGIASGGYGTIGAVGLIRMAYPHAELFVVNDSGPGLQSLQDPEGIELRIADWKFDEIIPPGCVTCEGGRGQFTELIMWGIENDSALKVSLVGYDKDAILSSVFLKLTGPEYKVILVEETNRIHERFPDRFRRFLVDGDGHIMLLDYFGAQIEGTTCAQWVRAMVEGDDAVWTDRIVVE